jgi:SNF2 family DNA or RNA helicase
MTGENTGQEKDARRRKFQPDDKTQAPEADVFILSDAGATGLNLQRGQTLINYDTPMTAMVHAQRNGRVNRLGQTRDVDLIDLVTDTPFEQRARQRMNQKYDLRNVFTDPGEGLDDTGLAGYISRARHRRQELQESKHAQIAA